MLGVGNSCGILKTVSRFRISEDVLCLLNYIHSAKFHPLMQVGSFLLAMLGGTCHDGSLILTPKWPCLMAVNRAGSPSS